MKKIFTIAILALLAVLACGESNSPAGPTGWNNGSWTGETASLIPVTFTLDHPAITDWTMTISHVFADTTDTRTWLCSSTSIASDSSFSWNGTIDHDTLVYVFSFSGTFVTGDSLIGLWDSSVDYHLSSGHSGEDILGGSWTAVGSE